MRRAAPWPPHGLAWRPFAPWARPWLACSCTRPHPFSDHCALARCFRHRRHPEGAKTRRTVRPEYSMSVTGHSDWKGARSVSRCGIAAKPARGIVADRLAGLPRGMTWRCGCCLQGFSGKHLSQRDRYQRALFFAVLGKGVGARAWLMAARHPRQGRNDAKRGLGEPENGPGRALSG